MLKTRNTRSSLRAPCPICNRTKDGDCSWNEEVYLCHTYLDDPKIPGYKYKNQTKDGLWGVFTKESAAVKEHKKPIREKASTEFIYTFNHEPTVKVIRRDKGNGSKSFAQMHYKKGRWVPGLPNEFRHNIHLYQIDNFQNKRAIETGGRILIVEGEAKADKLLEMGIPATCSLGGSTKWKSYGYPNYLKDLEGARVVICPDRDAPGIEHAEQIAEDYPDAEWLYPYPDSHEWLSLPKANGLDISDWISQGANKEAILGAIGEKKFYRVYRYHPWARNLAIVNLRRITS